MKFTTTALALVLAATSTAAIAQYGAPPAPPPQRPSATPSGDQQQPANAKPKIAPSAKARNAIIDLNNAVLTKDKANIPAKVAAAKAVATSKEDHYLIAELQLQAAVADNDLATATAAVDDIAASTVISSTEVAKLYSALGGSYYNSKQYDQAATAFERASSLEPTNTDFLLSLGEARISQGRQADGVALFQRAIQLDTAAGKKTAEEVYKRALSVAYQAKLPDSLELGQAWLKAYPTAESWRNTVAIYRNTVHPDDEGTLDLLRLLQATNALTSPADYSLFASTDAALSNYNEASAVIDAGVAAKVLDPANPDYAPIAALVKGRTKATDADLETATKTAVNGTALLRIGDRYYGMGEYSKAVDLYRKALGKPGVDPNVANLHIGMGLARTGDKAGATAAFNAVTGDRAAIAKFWLLYLQQKA